MKKDEFRRERSKRKKENQLNNRFFVFTAAVMLMFGVLVYGLFDLQIVNGDKYAESASNQSIKTFRFTQYPEEVVL